MSNPLKPYRDELDGCICSYCAAVACSLMGRLDDRHRRAVANLVYLLKTNQHARRARGVPGAIYRSHNAK